MQTSSTWKSRVRGVLLKFLITVIAALILFGFTRTLSALGNLAADPTLSLAELGNLKQSPALHSGGGLLVLLITTLLAVYKPWGMTRNGRPARLYLLLGAFGLILLFLVLHLLGSGPRGH
jgi:hypothetical protein